MTESNVSAQPAMADPVIGRWVDFFAGILDGGVPSAYRIWKEGHMQMKAGDAKAANRCEQLNYLLHNSSIPSSVVLGEGVNFGYGGIGVVLHGLSEIGRGVVIGANVTLGGKTNTKGRAGQDRRVYVPKIGDYVYLATGCKILGGVEVGAFSIIGANSVVVDDVPPLSVAAGVPAKVVRSITVENCRSYRGSFPALKNCTEDEYVALIRAAAGK